MSNHARPTESTKPETQEQITITKGSDAWYVTAERHIDLFGTDTIPAPFTPAADPQMVLATIQARNPNATVRIA